MRKYRKYFLVCFFMFLPVLTFAKVTCSNGDYSATIDIDKNLMSMEDTSKITIESTYTYEVTYNTNNDIVSISTDGIITPNKVGNAKINTIIKFFNESEEVAECNSNIDISVLSSDSTLKSLTIEELDISSLFKSDLYEYVVTLPYNYEKVNIIAIPNDEKAEISGDGRRYLNEGINEFNIIVKANDGTASTYKIKIIREDANNDATLKNLIVEGYVLEPKFSKDIYEYNLNVDNSVSNIVISAESTYELAKIIGVGDYKLATGDNEFNITVVAEDNTEQKYTINVNKSRGKSKLESLEIKGYVLDKKFKSDTFIYHIDVLNETEKLDISAVSSDNDQIEIIGNENLVIGENNIIIRVSNEEKGATTYKLVVNRLTKEEEIQKEKNNKIIDILLIIFIILVIAMFSLITVFIIRNYKINKKKKVVKLKKYKK